MADSLREILKQYAGSMDSGRDSYIRDFLSSEEFTREYLDNTQGYRLRNPDVLSISPEHIAKDIEARDDLDKLIHAYIKLLPFTERLDAITEFNHLFAKGHITCGYQLWLLRKSTAGRTSSRNLYCRTEDLLDGVEIEILLLKRLQKGELELILNLEENNEYDYFRQPRNTQERLAEEFCMSRAAIMKHIEKLKHTHNLLGYDLNIQLDEQSREYGGTTIHPVFLALNPSEAVLLTVWLKKRFPEEEGRLGQQASILADDIFRQLSNHGKEIVRKKAKDAGILFDESLSPRDSVPQHRLENYRNDIAICLKTSVHCIIKLREEDGIEHKGYLKSNDGRTYELRNAQGVPELRDGMGFPRKLKEEDIIFFSVI